MEGWRGEGVEGVRVDTWKYHTAPNTALLKYTGVNPTATRMILVTDTSVIAVMVYHHHRQHRHLHLHTFATSPPPSSSSSSPQAASLPPLSPTISSRIPVFVIFLASPVLRRCVHTPTPFYKDQSNARKANAAGGHKLRAHHGIADPQRHLERGPGERIELGPYSGLRFRIYTGIQGLGIQGLGI